VLRERRGATGRDEQCSGNRRRGNLPQVAASVQLTSEVAGIQLRGLTKSFPAPGGPVRAVDGLDISIGAGETVALLGPNGAGKSTTIDMLLGLMAPDSGSVTVFGMPPGRAVAEGSIGAMLQVGSLIQNLTVRELVTMMASFYPEPLDVGEVLALTRIEGIADRRTERLSGGETQRARFAVALVSNPELLVLDEPTVAMDVESRHAFWTTMREFASRGKTIVFATHDLDEADAYADRAVLMAGGQVVADGPTTEIKASELSGVASADRRGDAVLLRCTDSDAAIRALLAGFPEARNIEISGAGLEEAFRQLTANPGETREVAEAG